MEVLGQGGDVDANGDIVNELRELARGPFPVRIPLLRDAIATGSVVDIDQHLLRVARDIRRTSRSALDRWCPSAS